MMDKIFTPEIKKITDAKVALYEGYKRPAMLEILHILMEHYGHITLEIEKAIAEYLEVSPMDVREVVTFYTLYYTKERAKVRFNVCRTLACHLKGAGEIVSCFEEKLGIKSGQTTEDGKFELKEVECLGACEIAPMLQLNDDEYYGDLTPEKVQELIEAAEKIEEVASP